VAANYGAIKPVDPLWHRRDVLVRVRCEACGHARLLRLGDWAVLFRLSPEMPLYRFESRLRCSRCGTRKAIMEFPRGALSRPDLAPRAG